MIFTNDVLVLAACRLDIPFKYIRVLNDVVRSWNKTIHCQGKVVATFGHGEVFNLTRWSRVLRDTAALLARLRDWALVRASEVYGAVID